MITIKHQLLCKDFFKPNWKIKQLFLGTFNPEGGEKVGYFYGREARNYTWRTLTDIFDTQFSNVIFPIEKLTDTNLNIFINHLKENEIACMDMIRTVTVNENDSDKITGKGYADANLISGNNEIEYNTKEILEVIKNNPGISVYSTWGNGPTLRSWLIEIAKIPSIIPLISPSGAARVPAGNSKRNYILNDWGHKIMDKKFEAKENNKGKKKMEKRNRVKFTIDNKIYWLEIFEDGSYKIYIENDNIKLMVKPILINVVIPHIKATYGFVIELNHIKTAKNTRTLAKEVMDFYDRKQ